MAINCDREHRNFACIYMITFKRDGRRYIGQTVNFCRRMSDYRSAFRKLSGIEHQAWIRYLQIRYGVKDFENEFDVEILAEINTENITKEEVIEELNKLEILYIKEYGTYDKSFKRGFNYTSGGTGNYTVSDNVYQHTKNSDVGRPSCFVYDIEKEELTFYLTMQSAADDIGTRKANLAKTYYSQQVYAGRYKAFETCYSDRFKRMHRIADDSFKKISNFLKNKDSPNATATAKNLTNSLFLSLTIETLIFQTYQFDDTSTDTFYAQYLHWVLPKIEDLRRIIAIYGFGEPNLISIPDKIKYILYAGNGTRVFGNNMLIVYDAVSDIAWRCKSIAEAGETIGVRKAKILEALKHGDMIRSRYFVYYNDRELCQKTVEFARTHFRPKTDVERSRRYQYISISHRLFPITLDR